MRPRPRVQVTTHTGASPIRLLRRAGDPSKMRQRYRAFLCWLAHHCGKAATFLSKAKSSRDLDGRQGVRIGNGRAPGEMNATRTDPAHQVQMEVIYWRAEGKCGGDMRKVVLGMLTGIGIGIAGLLCRVGRANCRWWPWRCCGASGRAAAGSIRRLLCAPAPCMRIQGGARRGRPRKLPQVP